MPAFSFATHPLHNPAKLMEAYQPLMDYLNARLKNARFFLEASRDYGVFERKYQERKPAFLLPNPWQTLQAMKAGYHVIAMAGEPADFKGIFIVRKDGGIERPADLKGKAVSYPAPTALAACIMPQYFLHRNGVDVKRDIENRFVGSQESSIMNVYLGETAAGATWPPPWRAFQRAHPREAAELESANKELEAFSYSVSHDLRAPLRHISGFVNLLRAHISACLDEKGLRYMEVISGSAVQMGKLIDDVLSFSRMGRLEIVKTRVSLQDLLTEVLQLLEPDIEGTGIEWRIGPLPEVHGSREMLRIVMLNLVSNAVKFTGGRSGTIIEIGHVSEVEEDVVFVRDNGAGFDMQYADKLFGLFQRLHTVGEFEGTGLGLANVRRIIRRHGGRTWAEGIPGKGATFFFSLPKS